MSKTAATSVNMKIVINRYGVSKYSRKSPSYKPTVIDKKLPAAVGTLRNSSLSWRKQVAPLPKVSSRKHIANAKRPTSDSTYRTTKTKADNLLEKNSHVDQQQPMDKHRNHRANRISPISRLCCCAISGRPVVSTCANTPEHWLLYTHCDQEHHQHKVQEQEKATQVRRHREAKNLERVIFPIRLRRTPGVEYDHPRHAEQVIHDTPTQDRDAQGPVGFNVQLRQDRLAQHEGDQAEHEPHLRHDERPLHDSRPQGFGHQADDGM
mmetsp:Transcript_22402/g.76756  ORF Transcript_22402/g.76756 Transcript_22402/m.76756 type:complete len:265 (+) Transcript_22402:603-1397(+)